MHGRDVLKRLRSITVERAEVRLAANHVMTVLRDGDGKAIKLFGMRFDSVVSAVLGPPSHSRTIRSKLTRAADTEVMRILNDMKAAVPAHEWQQLVKARRDRTFKGTFAKRITAVAGCAATEGVSREELLTRVGKAWDEATVREVMEK